MAKKLTFGQNPTIEEKTAMATKRGYDTGKKSKDAAKGTSWKGKPIIGKSKVGVTIMRKTGK